MNRRDLSGWLVSLPAVMTMIALTATPVLVVVVGAVSPTGWTRLGELSRTPMFSQTLVNTAVWVLLGAGGSLVFGIAGALALQRLSDRAAGLWRAALLIPWVTPIVAAATAWKWFYSRDYGALNAILQRLGIIDGPVSWLTDSHLALAAVALVHVWATFSFVMLMVSAGLQAIPTELYEAATVDGAGPARTLVSVTFPGIRDILFIVALIVTIWTVNSFLPVWVITRGGPAGATNILPVQLYQMFQSGDETGLKVLAAIQLLISMAVAALYVNRTRKEAV